MVFDKKKFIQFFLQKKNYRLILIFICSICLLVILSNLQKDDTQQIEKESFTFENTYDVEEYTAKMEEKLCSILEGIDGVGNVEVMLTLDRGSEYVLAQDSKSQKSTSMNEERLSREEDIESRPLIIKGSKGDEAVLLKQVEPKARGVVIVCDGGDIPIVRETVSSSVKALLEIPSNKIYVTKMKDGRK